MYTVSEISQKLGISKSIIYKKLTSIENIAEHVSIKGRTKYIDDIGLELIEKILENKVDTEMLSENEIDELEDCTEEALKNESDESKTSIKKISEDKYDELLEKNNKYIKMLEDEVEYLKEEIQLKNNLIAEQSRQLGNNQLLLIESKKKILMLETSVTLEKETKRRIIRFPKGLAIFKKFFTNKQYS